jgi:hypothetical protein
MSNAVFGIQNRVLTGNLATGSHLVGLTIGNLQDQQLSDASSWRTAGSLSWTTGAYARCEAVEGVPVPWRAWGLFRTNLTLAATVRFLAANEAGFATVTYNSGWLPAEIVPGIGQALHISPADVMGQYARIDVEDPTNPDGFISVGGAYMGPIWQPRVNLSEETAIAPERVRSIVTARSGAKYVTPQHYLRGWDLAHDNLAGSDVWGEFWRLEQVAQSGENVLFVPDPASADATAEAIFGLMELTSNITFQTRTGTHRAWRGRITERL